jgi:hypothetical protein
MACGGHEPHREPAGGRLESSGLEDANHRVNVIELGGSSSSALASCHPAITGLPVCTPITAK